MLQALQPISCHLGVGVQNHKIPVWVEFRRFVDARNETLIVLVPSHGHFVCSGECL